MGYGKCTHEITKTKTYEEQGRSRVTKDVTTRCKCNKFYTTIPKTQRTIIYYEQTKEKRRYEEIDHSIGTVCDTCGHVMAYHQ